MNLAYFLLRLTDAAKAAAIEAKALKAQQGTVPPIGNAVALCIGMGGCFAAWAKLLRHHCLGLCLSSFERHSGDCFLLSTEDNVWAYLGMGI